MAQAQTFYGEHAVHFYESDAELAATVVPYLAAGARADETLIVIAQDAHRRAFEAGLEKEGVDVASARAGGSVVLLDAAETLAAFVRPDGLDGGAFDEVVGGVVRSAARRGRGIRAYGEMVALLWDGGDVLGAIELERLWNELACVFTFSLLCAYPSASVEGHEHLDALHEVCDLHSAVVAPPGLRAAGQQADMRLAPDLDAPARARSFVRATLRRWGHTGTVLDCAALVSSELTANAVVHVRSPLSLAISSTAGGVRICVSDAAPAPRGSWAMRPTHGLSIVDALCDSWGIEEVHEGKTVWALLPLGDETSC